MMKNLISFKIFLLALACLFLSIAFVLVGSFRLDGQVVVVVVVVVVVMLLLFVCLIWVEVINLYKCRLV